MFFDKPFHDLTFEDVVRFCEKRLPEGKQLDYKYQLPKNHEKFAKTIASFANALGGIIIVGVQDDRNDKPCPPFTGIPYHEKVRNSVEDIIQVYIDPVVFVDINVCMSKNGERMFVLIQIPQSNLTPHLVGPLKRAYVRTGQASRPEAIVHPEKLPWLLDHRKKSENLRHILYDKAESHFDNYLQTRAASLQGEAVGTLALLPMYPQDPLADYKKLPALISGSSVQAAYGTMANPEFPLLPVQDGAVVISNKRGEYKMTEFNAYGLVMNKQVISSEEIVNGHPASTIRFEKIAQNITLFFLTSRKFLNQLSGSGALAFRLKLENLCARRALFADRQATMLENYLRLDRTFNYTDLQSKLPEILEEILHEVAWSLGLQIPAKTLKELQQQLYREAR